MNRQLKMGDTEFDEYDEGNLKERGGYDPRTDFSTMGLSDEEIARKLQMEEYNPTVSYITRDEDKIPTPREFSAFNESYAEAQRRNADNRIRQIEQAQERRERELQADRAERQRELQAERDERQREREQRARAERERDEERNKRQALENIANYATIVRHTYPASFDRIYNWGLTLVPNYYDYETRQLLREQLSKLIKRELLLHSTETEVEDKIRRLINDAEYDSMLKKESTTAVQSTDTPIQSTTAVQSEATPKKQRKAKSKKQAKSRKKNVKSKRIKK